MRPKIMALALPAVFSLLAGLWSLVPPSPTVDPFWALLSLLRPPLAELREPLILDAPPGPPLSPRRLALDLRTLEEFGAGEVLVDLPVDWAADESTSTAALSRLKSSIETEFDHLSGDLGALWEGLRSGYLKPAEAARYFEALGASVGASRGRLVEEATPRSKEVPALVAALSLHPDVWFALGLLPIAEGADAATSAFLDTRAVPRPDRAKTEYRYSLPKIAGLALPPEGVGEILGRSGFSLRAGDAAPRPGPFAIGEFRPVAVLEGRDIPAAATLLLASRLRAEKVRLERGGLRLTEAELPRGARRDVFIPLDSGGRALFDRGLPGRSPRRASLDRLAAFRQAEADAVAALRAIEKAGYLVDSEPPSRLWDRAEVLGEALLGDAASRDAVRGDATGGEVAGGEDGSGLGAWVAAKAAFVEAAEKSLSEKDRIDRLCEGLLTTPNLDEAGRAGILRLREDAARLFGGAATALSTMAGGRAWLAEELGGSLVLVGEEPHVSRSGFVPEKASPPVDPSAETAAFLRAGLSDRFIGVEAVSTAWFLAVVAGLALSLLLLWAEPRIVLLAGAAAAAGLILVSGFLLAAAGSWSSPLGPALAALAPGLAASFLEGLRRRSSTQGNSID